MGGLCEFEGHVREVWEKGGDSRVGEWRGDEYECRKLFIEAPGMEVGCRVKGALGKGRERVEEPFSEECPSFWYCSNVTKK